MQKVLLISSFAVFARCNLPQPRNLGTSCGEYKGEFHLIYDISTSFEDDLVTLKAVARELFDHLNTEFPRSRFGIGTFSDKNIEGFGLPYDICYETNRGLTTDLEAVYSSINSIKVLNGFDPRESQLDAMFHGAMSSKVGWSDKDRDDPLNPTVRVMIVATDADYHTAGDASSRPPHDGRSEPACTDLDYPTVNQVKTALQSKGIIPLFLVDRYESEYRNLVNKMGIQGFVRTLSSDSSNVIQAIRDGLEEITCTLISTVDPPTIAPPAEESGGISTGIIVGAAVTGTVAVAAAIGSGIYFLKPAAEGVAAVDITEQEEELERPPVEREMTAALDRAAYY